MSAIEFIKILKRRLFVGKYGWFGNYSSWKEALENSGGYEHTIILEKVKDATLKVKTGTAVYERDSVLFDKINYSWPLLSSLLWVASKNKGLLSVIDFGGSLGSSYFQNKQFLDGLEKVEWSIVEQSNFVLCGQQNVANDTLQFYFSIKDCIAARGLPDVLLVACTLPYLERPYEFIHELMQYKIPYIIIDNTPFNYKNNNRLTIQKTHPAIYPASYPCWFLNYDAVKENFSQEYSILYEYHNDLYIHLDGHKIPYQGFMAALKHSL